MSFRDFRSYEGRGRYIKYSEDLTIEGQLCKYMPTRLFLDALTYHYIYLASPTQWDDPMETQYMNWLRNNYYQSAPQMARELLNYSVFATCFMMNNGINEEVLWNNYSHGSSMCNRYLCTNKFQKLAM